MGATWAAAAFHNNELKQIPVSLIEWQLPTTDQLIWTTIHHMYTVKADKVIRT